MLQVKGVAACFCKLVEFPQCSVISLELVKLSSASYKFPSLATHPLACTKDLRLFKIIIIRSNRV